VLLLISGIVVPLTELPGAMRSIVQWLPSTALAQLVRGAFGFEVTGGRPWLVLIVWAVAAVGAAVRWFRWE
jgi:ABC-2 type transport system permease protein